MKVKSCICTHSSAYLHNPKMKTTPQGIVIHSTGANNPYIKRYVQPTADNSNCREILTDIGKNEHNNDWNRVDLKTNPRRVCPHGIVGLNAKNEVCAYQILPYELCCNGCGKGKNGSYNTHPPYIQIETCEDDLRDTSYFLKCMAILAEWCAELSEVYGIPINRIVSHKEAHIQGYATNHRDINHWLALYNWDMDDFRELVRVKKEKIEKNKEHKYYKVQIGAFTSRENAEKLKAELEAKGYNCFIVQS